MSRDLDRYRQFSRRALLLAGAQGTVLTVLAGRLYYLQIVESERFKTLAEDNRINLRVLPPPRGYILDRNGKPLAVNRLDYRVTIVAEEAGDVEATLEALSVILPIDDADWQRVLKDVKRNRKFVPVAVRGNLSWEDVARIEVNALDLPGISVEVGQSRHYPHSELLSHIIGYVAPVADGDPIDDPVLQLPGFQIGKAGIEKVYELSLRGRGGRSQVEVNAVGRVIRELERKEGQAGANLLLTLDLDLQRFAYDRFGDEVGSAVVMDVQTGAIVTMVSKPGYDTNAFTRGLSVADWKALLNNPRGPLINKAISGQYAPGSTFKPVVALAALERGTITPATRVVCTGKTRLGNAVFHCWRRGGHGGVDLHRGIAQSCDCYFYELARRTGAEAIAEMAHRLGVGVRVGVDLPAEKAGLVPTVAWKQKRFGKPWNPGETLIAGIGQGYVLATPMQLAVMAARIANGAAAVAPRFALDPAPPPGQASRPRAASDRLAVNRTHLRLVQEAMDAVVNAGYGTANKSAIRDPGWRMAGKTGTAQVRTITRAERARGVRKNEHLPWEKRDHALFIAYAPADSPRYAIAVIVEHGGGGSKVAAPIARDILVELHRLDQQRQQPAPVRTVGRDEPHYGPG